MQFNALTSLVMEYEVWRKACFLTPYKCCLFCEESFISERGIEANMCDAVRIVLTCSNTFSVQCAKITVKHLSNDFLSKCQHCGAIKMMA